jgi:uncharacterized membrane protein (UPF0127 family)
MDHLIAPRLRRLITATVLGHEVPVAEGFRARLLGLTFLDVEEAGAGLLIPRCASVHTFGMRFPLDILFLELETGVVAIHLGIPPRRVLSHRGAGAVLELVPRTGRNLHRIARLGGGESSRLPT